MNHVIIISRSFCSFGIFGSDESEFLSFDLFSRKLIFKCRCGMLGLVSSQNCEKVANHVSVLYNKILCNRTKNKELGKIAAKSIQSDGQFGPLSSYSCLFEFQLRHYSADTSMRRPFFKMIREKVGRPAAKSRDEKSDKLK